MSKHSSTSSKAISRALGFGFTLCLLLFFSTGAVVYKQYITDHVDLDSIGTNTHAELDTHEALTTNAHGLTYTAEGHGGGLDADLLDGQEASEFAGTGDVGDHLADTENPHDVTKAQVGLTDVADILDKLDATQAPTVNDDVDEGYSPGSHWFDVTNKKVYACTDNTDGAAQWTETTQEGTPGGADTQVQYNNSGAFGGDAGMTYNAGSDALDLAGWVSSLKFRFMDGDTNYVDMISPALASNWQLTLPTDNGTVGQFLYTDGDGVTSWQTAPGEGGGEANTASNVGTDGVGVWYQKTALDLEFRHIAPASSKITVVLNGQDIDLDLNITGTSFPGAPGEGDLFYHQTHDMSFQYDGSRWIPDTSYAPIILYVDGPAGADGAGQGFGSGGDATETIQECIDYCVPRSPGGNVTILVAQDTYVEELIPKPLTPTGAFTVMILGTLTNVDTGEADGDSTTSTVEDDGQGWTPSAHAGKLLRMTSGAADGQERFIRDNDADTLNVAGLFVNSPVGGTFSIDTLGTIISPGGGNVAVLLDHTSFWEFKYLEFSGGLNAILADNGSQHITVTSCEFDTQTHSAVWILAGSAISFESAYFHTATRAGIQLTSASSAVVGGGYFLGCNTGDFGTLGGIFIDSASTLTISKSYLDGNNKNGIFVTANGILSMFGGGANLNTITNHDTGGDFGVRATEGGRAGNATAQTYPGATNNTDHSADAATFATET